MKVVGLEGLAAIDGPDVHYFYIHAEGQDAFDGEWKSNPVWTNLEIAKNENNHSLGTLYVYGGPKQMEEMVDKAVDALTLD
jgi:ABC-type Fe3+-citrate transport system substrate-binding protein